MGLAKNIAAKRMAARAGFTLVELLMVISIMAIIGGMSLVMIGGARRDANAARTETQIRRIRQFIEARLEDYEVRLIPNRLANYNIGGSPLTAAQIAELRNRILIEYVRAEMPSRRGQVSSIDTAPPFGVKIPTDNFPSVHFVSDYSLVVRPDPVVPTNPPISLIDDMRNNPPATVARMARVLNGPSPSAGAFLVADVVPGIDDIIQDQAECLYEILNSHNDGERSGLDFIFHNEIGDTDNDGHKEILDAWGDPLQFTLHMHDHEGDTLDTPDADGAMNTEGPIAVHIDVTSVNMPN